MQYIKDQDIPRRRPYNVNNMFYFMQFAISLLYLIFSVATGYEYIFETNLNPIYRQSFDSQVQSDVSRGVNIIYMNPQG